MQRIAYRIKQFWRAHREQPGAEDLARAETHLSERLFALFLQMQPFEQAHAIRVLDRLTENGQLEPDLLTAALLHDVGKARHPLNPWERSLAVLVNRFLPGKAAIWAQGPASGWRAGLIVAAHHPEWGAQMAAEAGANPRVLWLIAHHQAASPPEGQDQHLLQALQRADQIS